MAQIIQTGNTADAAPRAREFTSLAGAAALAIFAVLAVSGSAQSSAGEAPPRAAGVTPGMLTIDRLFADPGLSGETLRGAQLSADGRLVTYLKGSEQHKDRMDLWAYDVRRGTHRMLIDAARLAGPVEKLSDEEAARRERQRIVALSGIVEYSVSADSRHVLVPLDGDLWLYDLTAPPASAVRRITQTPGYETDARFSPRGRYVSYVRDQNLWVYELATARERALTRDGGGLVSFGVAEFIAQEEMDRDTGYWWAPDESRIAYARVDESPVPETQRFEIRAEGVDVVKQRYPAAGGNNARVDLFVAPLADGAAVKVDLGADTDVYLARVDWFPDARRLAVQRQSRDQKRLDLLAVDAAHGTASTLVSERSDTWVPLHDDLRFLKRTPRFVWGSSRSGFHHLYLYADDGTLLRPLTQGPWMVSADGRGGALKGIDERTGVAYFVANLASPTERHLYAVDLEKPGAPRHVTAEPGWHSVRMAEDTGSFLDTFSTVDSPPAVTLRGRTGKVLATLVANRLDGAHPYAPYVASHSAVKFGTLPAADGQALQYQVITPPHMEPGKRYPAIVDVYGGPGVQNVTNSWNAFWGPWRQLLAQHGYVVFALDNRGSGLRGTRFEAASFHRLGGVEVDDQIAGAKWLASQPYVDPQRIGIFGWSYGGYMSLLSVLRAPDVFAAAVAGAPVTDWRLYDTHYTERYMGKPQDNAAGYEASEVLRQAATLHRPLLLIHGMADDNVLFTHSTALMKQLQDARAPFELMTYPGSKHALLRRPETGAHALAEVLGFFDSKLAAQH